MKSGSTDDKLRIKIQSTWISNFLTLFLIDFRVTASGPRKDEATRGRPCSTTASVQGARGTRLPVTHRDTAAPAACTRALQDRALLHVFLEGAPAVQLRDHRGLEARLARDEESVPDLGHRQGLPFSRTRLQGTTPALQIQAAVSRNREEGKERETR